MGKLIDPAKIQALQKKMLKIMVPSLGRSYWWALLVVVLYFTGSILLQVYGRLYPNTFIFAERFLMLILGFLFLVWILMTHTMLTKKICAWITLLISLMGGVLTLRHIWLQYRPPTSFYSGKVGMATTMGEVKHIAMQLYHGIPAASVVSWKLFGYSFTEITGVCFLLLIVLSVWQTSVKIDG